MFEWIILNHLETTQNDKVRFMKGNQLKLTQVELLSFYFLRVHMHHNGVEFTMKNVSSFFKLKISVVKLQVLCTIAISQINVKLHA